jgi:hypothetical protein
MCNIPATRQLPLPRPALRLLRPYLEHWTITAHPGGVPVWTAEHVSADGRAIRYLVAHSARELAGKLATAEVVEP